MSKAVTRKSRSAHSDLDDGDDEVMDEWKEGIPSYGPAKSPAPSKVCTGRVHTQSRNSVKQELTQQGDNLQRVVTAVLRVPYPVSEPHATPRHATRNFRAVLVESMNARSNLGNYGSDVGI